MTSSIVGLEVLCWSAVASRDLDVVTEFAKLSGQGLRAMDEKMRLGFNALLDVAEFPHEESSRPSGIIDVRWPRQRTYNPDAATDAGTLPESGCLCCEQPHEPPD